MSEENTELIRRGVEAFNRGGFEAVDGVFWSEDIVWDATPAGVPGLGIYRGREEVRKFFEEDWFGAFPFDEWELSADKVIDAGGDRVVSLMRQHGRGAASGAEVELEFGQVITLRDGKVVQVDIYLDREKALEAAGLRE
jgi:ketosteroid isomerase-like protein